ncbi:MAG: methyltransferase domain-containing protein [Deltaproteobacteria bacterium]|nr:methyltransferase domain-containing protein [Deltaproteobacteria bacterium]
MSQKLVEKHWDYSLHAKYYEFRPNYSDRAIDVLANYVGASKGDDYCVADIGAGTGNLSIMLLARGFNVTAVEPNDEMRNIGIERTGQSGNIEWIKASGIDTTLNDNSFDWVTFGSSFNVIDRNLALKETYRILKSRGYFSCMWNHRNLNDPIQNRAEDIIVAFVPNYDRGTRREDQRPVLEQNKDLFNDIFYSEIDFDVDRTIDEYINAWRSVKNKYWDLATEEGNILFQKITDKMREELPHTFKIRYTTRSWTLQKVV